MSKAQQARSSRSGRGGHGRSPYNHRGERLERILRDKGGIKIEWLLQRLAESEHPISRPTLYRARLPENDPLYINMNEEVWREIAKILGVHPSQILGTTSSEQLAAKAG